MRMSALRLLLWGLLGGIIGFCLLTVAYFGAALKEKDGFFVAPMAVGGFLLMVSAPTLFWIVIPTLKLASYLWTSLHRRRA
jgi:hypothetical protein